MDKSHVWGGTFSTSKSVCQEHPFIKLMFCPCTVKISHLNLTNLNCCNARDPLSKHREKKCLVSVAQVVDYLSRIRRLWVQIPNGSSTVFQHVLLVILHKWTLYQYLTHWGRDKIAAFFQTTFSNGLSWMKIFEFRLKFHWSLLLRVQLIIF